MLALLLLAASAVPGPAAPGDWVPMRWPASKPESLAALEGTPVNCILLEPDAWSADLLNGAKARGFSALAVIHPGPEAEPNVKKASAMAFSGLVLEGDFAPADRDHLRTGLSKPVIELPSRRGMRLESSDPVIGTSQGVWPGLEIEHGGKVVAGPTSSPWIFTNAGFLRFLRMPGLRTDRAVWIAVRPPAGNIYNPERYVQAIADAEICGARWVIALDEGLAGRLAQGEARALADWRMIARHLAFFEQRQNWRKWREWSRFAIIQNPQAGALMSGGLLDMIASQRIAVRSIPADEVTPATLEGARLILDVDPDSLSPAAIDEIHTFKKDGGQVLDPPAGWHFPKVPQGEFTLGRRQMDEMQPLWELTYKATLRKNFGVRTFNTTGVMSNTVGSPDGKSIVVFVVNYMDTPTESVTVHALGDWKQARLYLPDGTERELEIYPVADGVGFDLETLGTLAAIRLDR